MDLIQVYQSKVKTASEAAQMVKTGDRIVLSPVCGLPITIVNAVIERYEELSDVEFHSGMTLYPLPVLADPKYKGHIKYCSFFMGPAERKVFPMGLIGHTSVHFSKLDYYVKNIVKVNVLLADVSPPDDEGYMYFGPMGVSIAGGVAEFAQRKIVQVNKMQPKVNGEYHRIHINDVDCIVEQDHPLPPLPEAEISDIDRKIAEYIIPKIKDGSTIQIGLGGLANAIGYGLESKKNLSVHTEMLTESMMHLTKKGVITGKIVAGFALGSGEVYKFAGECPQVFLSPIYRVNNPSTVAQYDNFVSINSCLIVDLTGQVASEGIGTRLVSATGGASDYVRGATESKGGMSFICLPSTTEINGEVTSNIVAALPPATPVTVQRADVQYVVTEYGIADIYNRSLEERIHALIAVAHPDFRKELLAAAIGAKYIAKQ
jgi:acyl-CoA hydrolase